MAGPERVAASAGVFGGPFVKKGVGAGYDAASELRVGHSLSGLSVARGSAKLGAAVVFKGMVSTFLLVNSVVDFGVFAAGLAVCHP